VTVGLSRSLLKSGLDIGLSGSSPAGGQRLGCAFLLDGESSLFVHESEITPEIEALIASLGTPTEGLKDYGHKTERGAEAAETPADPREGAATLTPLRKTDTAFILQA